MKPSISYISLGESVNLQVIFRRESGAVVDFEDQILLMLETVSVERVATSSYLKLGASMMKIKSIESLTESHSPLASMQNSMDNLAVTEGHTIIHRDEKTLVYNLPLTISDLIEDDEYSDTEYSSSKRIKVSVSLFEKVVQEKTFDAIESKTIPFGGIAFRKLLRSTRNENQQALTHICILHKSLELVNPIDAVVSLAQISDTRLIIATKVSPTENMKNPLVIESFTLSASASYRSQLLAKVLQVQTIDGMVPEYPVTLQLGETFRFCHQVQIYEPTELIAFPEVFVEASLMGQYDNKPIRIELILPFDIKVP